MSLSKITQIARSSRALFRLAQPVKLVVQNVAPQRSVSSKMNKCFVLLPYSWSDGVVAKIGIGTLLAITVVGTVIMFPYEGFGSKDYSTSRSGDEATLLASILLSKLTPLNAGPDGQLNGFAMAQNEVENVIGNLNKTIQNCSDADEQKELQNGKKLFEDMLEYIVSQRQFHFPGQTCIGDVYIAVGKEASKHKLSEAEVDKIVMGVVGSKEEMMKKAKAYYSERANETALEMRPKLLKLKEDPEAYEKLQKMLANLPEDQLKAMKENVTLREPEGEMKVLLEKMLVFHQISEVQNEPSLDQIRQDMRAKLL